MASTSFLNQFQDLDFTNEEQGAVFTPTIQWDSMNDDSNLLIIGKLISSNSIDDNAVVRAFQGIWKHNKIVSITTVKSNYYRIKFPTEDIRNDILSRGPWIFKVADAESTNAPINPVATTVPMVVVIGTPFLAATDPLGTIIAMEPKLAAATAPIALTMAVANTPQVSIEPFGSTMVPTTNSFGGPEGFIDFLANPTETHTEVPYLLDNMGLDAVTTTILSIPREGGLENEMGKSFLATSSMLFMFDDWLSKKSSSHTATIDE
ncbi:hypothetical protein V6N13_090976 [Hibiscus sabdariffa]